MSDDPKRNIVLSVSHSGWHLFNFVRPLPENALATPLFNGTYTNRTTRDLFLETPVPC